DAQQIAVLELVSRLIPAEYAAWVSMSANGQFNCAHERATGSIHTQQCRTAAGMIAQQAAATGSPAFARWGNEWNIVASHVGESVPALVAIVPAALHQAMASAVCQMIVQRLFPTARRAASESANASITAAALELVVRLADSMNTTSAAKLVCDLVRQKL